MTPNRLLPLLLAMVAGACATTPIPSRDQMHVELRYTNQPRQLRASMIVAPFFRDDSRRLLTSQPPDETELLVTPRGKAIAPGDALEILPAGTRVTVMSVSFATRWQSFARPVMTPRERTWVELAVAGRPTQPAFVLALRPDLKTEDEVIAEVERWLTKDDVAAELAALPEADRQLVATRTPAPGVSKRALELAFGEPNRRDVRGEDTSVLEEWMWRSDAGVKRVASLKDGALTKFEVVKPPPAPEPAK